MQQTNRLNIIRLQEEDLKDIHHMNSIDIVNEYNTISIPKNISETKKMLSKALDETNTTNSGWSIRLKKGNIFIGELGMTLASPKYRMAEIHYSILPEFWGKGFATEAVNKIIDFGFNELKLHRIEAGVATENLASIKVLEKVGMTKEGHKRKILPIRNQWKDNYHYAILDEDKSKNH